MILMVHELKIWPRYFSDVADGKKLFELRCNDRNFQLGDILMLREWDKDAGYSGRIITANVSYLLPSSECPDGGLDAGYVILGLTDIDLDEGEDRVEDEVMICPQCAGSGEPVSGAPGNCYRCKGSGELKYEPDLEDWDWDDKKDDE
jgi:hypothetical protein